MFKAVKSAYRRALSMVYPRKCLCCGEITEDDSSLCVRCLPRIDSDRQKKICMTCGLEINDCVCSRRVFHFCGCTAPFRNDGAARRIMYGFKFRRRIPCGEYMALEMSRDVKRSFGEIEFDAVTYVPSSFRKKIKRGFNQSEVLARAVSRKLGLPLLSGVLSCRYSRASQHKLTFEKRYKNVRGMYSVRGKCSGTVLLVDDIKTSGATLDECAGKLLLAGADKVYCSVGLMTYIDKRNGE